jgi:hypothetical protein
MINDESSSNAQMTKGGTRKRYFLSFGFSAFVRASSFSHDTAVGIARSKKINSATVTDRRYRN